MKFKKIDIPFRRGEEKKLKAGDTVLLSGNIYTARDAAHKRMKNKLPGYLKGEAIYYAGPAPAKKNMAIGSCGPTTSSRMDIFTPILIKQGLKAMIGKGKRSEEVRKAIKKYHAVYFMAVGGCGAFFATKIKKAKKVAYVDLGPEAIYKLDVKDFPVIVGIDSFGRSV